MGDASRVLFEESASGTVIFFSRRRKCLHTRSMSVVGSGVACGPVVASRISSSESQSEASIPRLDGHTRKYGFEENTVGAICPPPDFWMKEDNSVTEVWGTFD